MYGTNNRMPVLLGMYVLDFKSQIMGTNYAEIFVFVFYVNNFHTYQAILVILHVSPYKYTYCLFLCISQSLLHIV
jgi:hypothetical protein